MQLVKLSLITLLLNGMLLAQDIPRFHLWQASVVSVAATQILDVASSWNQPESNPLFAPTFTAGDAVIKLTIIAGILGVQRCILHKYPKKRHVKLFSILNFTLAGVGAGVVYRNYSI